MCIQRSVWEKSYRLLLHTCALLMSAWGQGVEGVSKRLNITLYLTEKEYSFSEAAFVNDSRSDSDKRCVGSKWEKVERRTSVSQRTLYVLRSCGTEISKKIANWVKKRLKLKTIFCVAYFCIHLDKQPFA